MDDSKKGNGASELLTGVAPGSPFATMQNAIMALAAAQTKREKTQRVRAMFQLLKTFEASFVETARQLGCAERCLSEVTAGEFMTVAFKGRLPSGTSVRVVDSNELEVPILDLARGRILKLPAHVEPLSVELKLADGTVRRITPGQPVDVGGS